MASGLFPDSIKYDASMNASQAIHSLINAGNRPVILCLNIIRCYRELQLF